MELNAPLSQVKIVDFDCGIAGSFCAKLLAELGAQVIKVETTTTLMMVILENTQD